MCIVNRFIKVITELQAYIMREVGISMPGKCIKYMSLDVNGGGKLVKRNKIIAYLKSNQADIVFILETHLYVGEASKFRTALKPAFLTHLYNITTCLVGLNWPIRLEDNVSDNTKNFIPSDFLTRQTYKLKSDSV